MSRLEQYAKGRIAETLAGGTRLFCFLANEWFCAYPQLLEISWKKWAKNIGIYDDIQFDYIPDLAMELSLPRSMTEKYGFESWLILIEIEDTNKLKVDKLSAYGRLFDVFYFYNMEFSLLTSDRYGHNTQQIDLADIYWKMTFKDTYGMKSSIFPDILERLKGAVGEGCAMVQNAELQSAMKSSMKFRRGCPNRIREIPPRNR